MSDENGFYGLYGFPLGRYVLQYEMEKYIPVNQRADFMLMDLPRKLNPVMSPLLGETQFPQDMKGALSSIVLGDELAVLEAQVNRRTPTSSDFQTVTRTNADYLLHVYTAAGEAITAGGYNNMFNVNVSGVVSLYSLPYGEMVFSQTIPVQKGFGSSADSAGWDGYGRMRQDILNLASNAVGQLVR